MKELKEKQTDVCQHVSNKMPTQHSKMFKMLILKTGVRFFCQAKRKSVSKTIMDILLFNFGH